MAANGEREPSPSPYVNDSEQGIVRSPLAFQRAMPLSQAMSPKEPRGKLG
jgi:hypothetical protein